MNLCINRNWSVMSNEICEGPCTTHVAGSQLLSNSSTGKGCYFTCFMLKMWKPNEAWRLLEHSGLFSSLNTAMVCSSCYCYFSNFQCSSRSFQWDFQLDCRFEYDPKICQLFFQKGQLTLLAETWNILKCKILLSSVKGQAVKSASEGRVSWGIEGYCFSNQEQTIVFN